MAHSAQLMLLRSRSCRRTTDLVIATTASVQLAPNRSNDLAQAPLIGGVDVLIPWLDMKALAPPLLPNLQGMRSVLTAVACRSPLAWHGERGDVAATTPRNGAGHICWWMPLTTSS